jgi:hypothetical protein
MSHTSSLRLVDFPRSFLGIRNAFKLSSAREPPLEDIMLHIPPYMLQFRLSIFNHTSYTIAIPKVIYCRFVLWYFGVEIFCESTFSH